MDRQLSNHCFIVFRYICHVKQYTTEHCWNDGDCGNKYLHSSIHLWKCVVTNQFDNNGDTIWGLTLRGRQGYFIPAWAVLGKHMGKVVKGERNNKDSQYIVEINKTMFIDTEKGGSCTWFINHRCKDLNASHLSENSFNGHCGCLFCRTNPREWVCIDPFWIKVLQLFNVVYVALAVQNKFSGASFVVK